MTHDEIKNAMILQINKWFDKHEANPSMLLLGKDFVDAMGPERGKRIQLIHDQKPFIVDVKPLRQSPQAMEFV